MRNGMRTTRHQFEILVDYMERNGDIAKLKPNPLGKAKMSRHWEELSRILNNTRSGNGPVRTADQWRKVWSDFKTNVRRKVEKTKLLSIDNEYFNNTIEARTMAIINNEKPMDVYSEAGDTDDTDVKCVVDIRKALNLISESEEDELVISDDDKEKELKIDFSIQNFSENSYNIPEDEDVKCLDTSETRNVDSEKPKAKRGRKKKAKEQDTIQDTENESCPVNPKPKFSLPSTSNAFNIVNEETTQTQKNMKKPIYDHDSDDNLPVYNNIINTNSGLSRDKEAKPSSHDIIDLVPNNTEPDDYITRIKNLKKKFQEKYEANIVADTNNIINNYNINNATVNKAHDNKTETQIGSIPDNVPPSTKEGSLRQLLISKLLKKKMANQSQTFESETQMNFNNATAIPSEADAIASVIPNPVNNTVDNTATNMTPINLKRPAPESQPKPVQKRRRKVYSMLMENEREERKFERELTMMKFEIMREEIQLKNRGLFMFQKFLHLAEQFFINTNSVLK